MKAIWKIPVQATAKQTITIPRGATFLSMQVQKGELRIWVLVNPLETQKEYHHIAIYGTGQPMPDEPGRFLATLQMNDGDLVFHAFEYQERAHG